MKITVIGTGYVGLISAVCFAKIGHDVIGYDIDSNKIKRLQNGESVLYEANLEEYLKEAIDSGKINFTDNKEQALSDSEMVFIAVGTPSQDDGSADLKYVYKCADDIAEFLNEYKIIVTKSTVPVGTGANIKKQILKNKRDAKFDICSNPEFLREGNAIYDFMNPDRIVIGSENKEAAEKIANAYGNLVDQDKFIITDLQTSEMIKYASNGFLATKICFINEIANLCENVGANVKEVAKGMGLDHRIGENHLNPGPGYGGSCFPKDTKALKFIAEQNNSKVPLIETTIESNEIRKRELANRIINRADKDSEIAILGITFKANTDDLRDSPALDITKYILDSGLKVRVYDPQGLDNAKKELKEYNDISFYKNVEECIKKASILVILTEWSEFRNLDLENIKSLMLGNIIFDYRNILNGNKARKLGFEYNSIGNA